jgi:hypothetical protein
VTDDRGPFERLCAAARKGGHYEILLTVRAKKLFLQAARKDGETVEVPLNPLAPDNAALELARRLTGRK